MEMSGSRALASRLSQVLVSWARAICSEVRASNVISQGRSFPNRWSSGRKTLRTRLSLNTQVSRSPLAENALTVRQKMSQIVRKLSVAGASLKSVNFPALTKIN